MNILCIETATTMCSVAIGNETGLLACKELDNGYTHAENLHVFIDDVLKESGLSRKDIHAVSVSKGPGSYTGLRIGVSAAKGIAYTLGIPLLSINTLYNLAVEAKKQIQEQKAILCPMLDARRMEVYTAQYSFGLEEVKPTQALVLDETSILSFDESQLYYFFGDGAEKSKTLTAGKSNVKYLDGIVPSAKNMIEASVNKLKKGETEDVAYFEPFYLKEFFTGK